ncbi:MAG: hypothetical protein HGA33_00550 [Candidatus Moranbacteria bacterium]|nr:hypothetical protein [Candidatus Moranbacteria bacterium]
MEKIIAKIKEILASHPEAFISSGNWYTKTETRHWGWWGIWLHADSTVGNIDNGSYEGWAEFVCPREIADGWDEKRGDNDRLLEALAKEFPCLNEAWAGISENKNYCMSLEDGRYAWFDKSGKFLRWAGDGEADYLTRVLDRVHVDQLPELSGIPAIRTVVSEESFRTSEDFSEYDPDRCNNGGQYGFWENTNYLTLDDGSVVSVITKHTTAEMPYCEVCGRFNGTHREELPGIGDFWVAVCSSCRPPLPEVVGAEIKK